MDRIQQNLEIAKTLKENGNRFYKEKDYTAAIKQYVRIFLYIRGLEAPKELAGMMGPMGGQVTELMKAQIQDLELTANLNLAQCHLNLKHIDQALKFANGALAVDPNSAKGLYRRASAYIELKDSEKARDDLNKILQIHSDDVKLVELAKKLMKRVEMLEKEETKKQQALFAGAFK